MEIMTVLVAGAAVGILYKKFIIDPEKVAENYLEQKKNEPKKNNDSEKKSEAFFGIDKVKKNPEQFLVDIEKFAEKLERGEKVKVNASEALYMMRNSRYHNLIIGEDGTINFKKIAGDTGDSDETIKGDIFEERSAKKSKAIDSENLLPAYVKSVEKISDGGCRWVYHDWHVQNCQIPSVCFDKYGRSIPDPDKVVENNKAIGAKRNQGEKSESKKGEDALLVSIAKQLSKVKEMVQEDRVDKLLSKADEAHVDKIDHTDNNKQDDVVLLDEVEQLEKEFAIPDFDDVQIDSYKIAEYSENELIEQNATDDCEATDGVVDEEVDSKEDDLQIEQSTTSEELESNLFDENIGSEVGDTKEVVEIKTAPSIFEQNVEINYDDEIKSLSAPMGQGCLYLEEEIGDLDSEELDEEICCDNHQEVPHYEISYENYRSFIDAECKKPEFVDLVLENVFSEKGCGSVYVDYVSKKIIVEKNYFAKAIRSLMLPEHQKQFDRDFFNKTLFEIYDGNCMDELFSSMQKCEKIFDAHGRGSNKFLYNLLIEFVEIDQLFLSAWFVRIAFGSHATSDRFANSGWRIQEIRVIEDDKRKIDGMSRRIENLKRIF